MRLKAQVRLTLSRRRMELLRRRALSGAQGKAVDPLEHGESFPSTSGFRTRAGAFSAAESVNEAREQGRPHEVLTE